MNIKRDFLIFKFVKIEQVKVIIGYYWRRYFAKVECSYSESQNCMLLDKIIQNFNDKGIQLRHIRKNNTETETLEEALNKIKFRVNRSV